MASDGRTGSALKHVGLWASSGATMRRAMQPVSLTVFGCAIVRQVQPFVPSFAPAAHSPAVGVENHQPPNMQLMPPRDPGTNQPILDQPFLCNYGNAGPGGPPQPPPVDPEHWVQKGGCGCARSNITVGVDPAREQSGWGSLVPGR